jgi:hypothetical protein
MVLDDYLSFREMETFFDIINWHFTGGTLPPEVH